MNRRFERIDQMEWSNEATKHPGNSRLHYALGHKPPRLIEQNQTTGLYDHDWVSYDFDWSKTEKQPRWRRTRELQNGAPDANMDANERRTFRDALTAGGTQKAWDQLSMMAENAFGFVDGSKGRRRHESIKTVQVGQTSRHGIEEEPRPLRSLRRLLRQVQEIQRQGP